MKVGIDFFGAEQGGGNATYTRELANALISLRTPGYAFRLERHQRFLTLATLLQGLDIFHFTNPLNFSQGVRCKKIITLHDIAPAHNKDWVKPSTKKFFDEKFAELIRSADFFIAVSEYTKQDVTSFFAIDPRKIQVVYEGASGEYYPDSDASTIKRTFGLDNFILCTGQLQRRKNVISLIEAYAVLPVSVRKEFTLAFAGTSKDPEYSREIAERVSALGLGDRVQFLGRVETPLMRKLYSTTSCFVYPSSFEGFGLPPLEAMQCGAPVVSSSLTSLPEVCGDAAVMVDPSDIESMSAALYRVVSDKSFAEELRLRGQKRARDFSWRRAAQETLSCYEMCYDMTR